MNSIPSLQSTTLYGYSSPLDEIACTVKVNVSRPAYDAYLLLSVIERDWR